MSDPESPMNILYLRLKTLQTKNGMSAPANTMESMANSGSWCVMKKVPRMQLEMMPSPEARPSTPSTILSAFISPTPASSETIRLTAFGM